MWERQYEHARWNGHKLNILSTSWDGGTRLQVSDIPYADRPHIKVMGSKARNYTIEAVFVGANSLADANTLVAKLEESPEGELEHPWLGELSLVFEDVSGSISIKKGIVTIGLKFVGAGASPSITATTTVRTKAQASTVESLSKQSFASEVKDLGVSQTNQVQEDATSALNVLVDITNRINIAGETLKDINHAINEAFSAVSSISTNPTEFADLLNTSIDAVADGVQSEPDSESEAIDNARSAQKLLLDEVKAETPTQHHNVQMVTGAVKMSKDITNLEKNDTFDITLAVKQPETTKGDLSTLIENIDERVKAVTQVSTVESIELFDALTALKSNVKTQYDKVVEGTTPHRTIEAPHFKPALIVAHDEFTGEQIITKMNALQHPLFLHGDIAVRDEQ